MNSVLYVSFAKIPPTFAAALTMTSGLTESIVNLVCSKENKSVSCLVEAITSENISEELNFLIKEDPTSPLLPKIKTFISHLSFSILKKIII